MYYVVTDKETSEFNIKFMRDFINILIILIGAFLLACVIFIENLSYDEAGCLVFVGVLFVFLGWVYNSFLDK